MVACRHTYVSVSGGFVTALSPVSNVCYTNLKATRACILGTLCDSRKVGDNTSQLAPLRILLTSRFAFYNINWIDKNTMVSACTSIIHYWPCCLIEDTILICTTWETLHFEQRSSVSLFFLHRQTNAYLMSSTANKLLCLHTRTFFPCAIALWNNLPPFLQNSNSLQTIYCSNSFIIIVIVIVDLHVFHECFLLAD